MLTDSVDEPPALLESTIMHALVFTAVACTVIIVEVPEDDDKESFEYVPWHWSLVMTQWTVTLSVNVCEAVVPT